MIPIYFHEGNGNPPFRVISTSVWHILYHKNLCLREKEDAVHLSMLAFLFCCTSFGNYGLSWFLFFFPWGKYYWYTLKTAVFLIPRRKSLSRTYWAPIQSVRQTALTGANTSSCTSLVQEHILLLHSPLLLQSACTALDSYFLLSSTLKKLAFILRQTKTCSSDPAVQSPLGKKDR